MKRSIALLSILALLLGLFGCMASPEPTESTAPPTTQPSTTQPPTTEPPTTEPTTTQPPEPYVIRNTFAWVYPATSGTIWAMAIGVVENTGTENIFLDYGTMELSDQEGRTVGRIGSVSAYPQILAPGMVGYYCDVIALDLAEVEQLQVKLDAPISVTQKEAAFYSLSQLELTDTDFGGMVISGEVSNSTEQTGELVCVCAILYDQNKVASGVIRGYLEQPLEPGESAEFSFESYMLPTYLEWENVSRYVVYSYDLEDGP